MIRNSTAAIVLALLAGWACKTSEPAVVEPTEPTEPAVEAPTESDDPAREGAVDEQHTERVEAEESSADASEVNDDEPPTTFVPEPKVPKKLSLQEMAFARASEQQVGPGEESWIVLAPERDDSVDDVCGGESTAVMASLDPESDERYRIEECRRAIDAIHAKNYTRHVTKFGATDISFVAVRHNGTDLWTAADACEELLGEVCFSDFVEGLARVRSLVGPILTIDLTWSEADGGGAPHHGQDVFTFDTRTGKQAPFTALIAEDSLLNALKRDTFLRKTIDPVRLDAAKSVDEVWDLWRTQDFAHFGSYYFHEWDAETGRVAIRIMFLEDSAGLSSNKLKELGLWVTPKKQYLSAFEAAAADGGGFYAGD